MCAFLLSLLNKSEGHKTKFVVSDEHSNITACTLPEWLPGGIVYSMVVEFSRRLRVELQNAMDSKSSGHDRMNAEEEAFSERFER